MLSLYESRDMDELNLNWGVKRNFLQVAKALRLICLNIYTREELEILSNHPNALQALMYLHLHNYIVL